MPAACHLHSIRMRHGETRRDHSLLGILKLSPPSYPPFLYYYLSAIFICLSPASHLSLSHPCIGKEDEGGGRRGRKKETDRTDWTEDRGEKRTDGTGGQGQDKTDRDRGRGGRAGQGRHAWPRRAHTHTWHRHASRQHARPHSNIQHICSLLCVCACYALKFLLPCVPPCQQPQTFFFFLFENTCLHAPEPLSLSLFSSPPSHVSLQNLPRWHRFGLLPPNSFLHAHTHARPHPTSNVNARW